MSNDHSAIIEINNVKSPLLGNKHNNKHFNEDVDDGFLKVCSHPGALNHSCDVKIAESSDDAEMIDDNDVNLNKLPTTCIDCKAMHQDIEDIKVGLDRLESFMGENINEVMNLISRLQFEEGGGAFMDDGDGTESAVSSEYYTEGLVNDHIAVSAV